MEIREAQPSDLSQVLDLLRRQLREQDVAISDESLRHGVRGIIENPENGRVLVATQSGDIAGVAVLSFLWTLEHGGPAVWLDELYVEPVHRRSGIGEQLVQAAIALARARNCRALDLEVEQPGRESAERLYERLGFRRHRRVRWVYPLHSST